VVVVVVASAACELAGEGAVDDLRECRVDVDGIADVPDGESYRRYRVVPTGEGEVIARTRSPSTAAGIRNIL